MKLVHQLNEIQIKELHELYKNEWWCKDRTLEDTATCVQNSSLIFAFIESEQLVAFARVLTDGVFKAFLFDVIIAPQKRGQGLGTAMLHAIQNHALISKVKNLELYCVPELIPYYENLGFSSDVSPMRLMRLTRHD
jgi:predicted GNAT family N-acyltransferase